MLHFIGIVVMFWRKKYREAALLYLPLAMLFAFNQAASGRSECFDDVFLVANSAGIAAMALTDRLRAGGPSARSCPRRS